MKKFLLIAFLGSLGLTSHAQFGKASAFPLVAGDTLNNTDTVTKFIPATAGYSCTGIQINLNKISGTIAGHAYLYESLDGVNYFPTDTASYVTLSTTTPAISTPVAAAVATFSKATVPWVYYAVVATSSGTVSAQVRVLYTLRKYSTAISTN